MRERGRATIVFALRLDFLNYLRESSGRGVSHLQADLFFFVISEVVAQWCTQGDLLAVAGMERQTQLGDLPNGPLLKSAMVKFYNVRGEHIFTLDTLVQVRACVRHSLGALCSHARPPVNTREWVIL